MSRASTARSDFVCEVESASKPGDTYEVRVTKEGGISCGCTAWRFSSGKGLSTLPTPGLRWCKHLEGIKRQANREGVWPKTEYELAQYARDGEFEAAAAKVGPVSRTMAAPKPATTTKPAMDPMARVLMDALYEVASVRIMAPHAEAVWERVKQQLASAPVMPPKVAAAANSVVDFVRPRRRILVE